jgi:hypothetical protein
MTGAERIHKVLRMSGLLNLNITVGNTTLGRSRIGYSDRESETNLADFGGFSEKSTGTLNRDIEIVREFGETARVWEDLCRLSEQV